MNSSKIKLCPSCDRELQSISDDRQNIVVDCDRCEFFASIRDIDRAEYLANFRPMPDVRVAAQRIAARAPLNRLAMAQSS